MPSERIRTEDATDLNFSRVIDAPRQTVFKVWTDAEHFAQWFGPREVAIPFCKIDPRPGGVLHFCHRLGDGMEVWLKGVYRDFAAPERLVFALSFVDSSGRPAAHPMLPDWPLDTVILTTVTFADHDGKTQLTVRQVLEPPAAAAKDAVKRERKAAKEGWAETLERLDEYLGAKTPHLPRAQHSAS
ncbi:MAG TPA: SRPBCC domain-containing protein [Xanthobacteraceae bacterium]|jgi:uncharacterized protein YndB with AHSA1/START domain